MTNMTVTPLGTDLLQRVIDLEIVLFNQHGIDTTKKSIVARFFKAQNKHFTYSNELFKAIVEAIAHIGKYKRVVA